MMTTIFQFSGGKDSIAVLLLMKDRLHEITVVWADSGDAFPETKVQMEKVAAMCPNFIRVQGRQPESIAEFGYPVDVLPVSNHAAVSYLTQQDRPKLQGFLDCCARGFLAPMHEAVLAMGATTIIRGQKLCDGHKSPIRDGDVIDGITYLMPIQDWTDNQVMQFIKDSDLLPAHYENARTSLDCMHCTAYLAENQWKLPYLQKNHPDIAVEVGNRIRLIQREVRRDMQHLDSLIGE